MSTIVFYEHQLGNVLAFWANARGLKGDERIEFLDEKAELMEAYSQANARNFAKSCPGETAEVTSARDIRVKASRACNPGEAKRNARLLHYNTHKAETPVLKMIAEIMHYVFSDEWCRHPDTWKGRLAPDSPEAVRKPQFFNLYSLSLIASVAAMIRRTPREPEKTTTIYAQHMAILSQANAVLTGSNIHDAQQIKQTISHRSDSFRETYFKLINRLYFSVPQDAAADVWEVIIHHYGHGLFMNEHRSLWQATSSNDKRYQLRVQILSDISTLIDNDHEEAAYCLIEFHDIDPEDNELDECALSELADNQDIIREMAQEIRLG